MECTTACIHKSVYGLRFLRVTKNWMKITRALDDTKNRVGMEWENQY